MGIFDGLKLGQDEEEGGGIFDGLDLPASPSIGLDLGPDKQVKPIQIGVESGARMPAAERREKLKRGELEEGFPAMAGAVANIFEGIDVGLQNTPVVGEVYSGIKTVIQLVGAGTGAGLAGAVDPIASKLDKRASTVEAWTRRYDAGVAVLEERYGRELTLAEKVQAAPGFGQVVDEVIGPAESLPGQAIQTAVVFLLDMVTDPTILLTGEARVAKELARYAASGKTAIAGVEAIPRATAAGLALKHGVGSSVAGAVYGPQIAEGVLRGVEEGRYGDAVGAALIGTYVAYGINREFQQRFGRPPTDAEVVGELERLHAQALAEGKAPERWADEVPPPWVGEVPLPEQPKGKKDKKGKKRTETVRLAFEVPEAEPGMLRSQAEVRADLMEVRGVPRIWSWGYPEPDRAPLPEKSAPYATAGDNALQAAVQEATLAVADAPAAPPKVDDFTSPGISQGALSPEELSRAARKETYYKVNRDGTVTYQGHQPDPIGALKPGEGVVKVLPGLDPMVTQASGPDSKVLERFTLAAKKAPELLGVPERRVAELEAPAVEETLGQRLRREQGLEGPPAPVARESAVAPATPEVPRLPRDLHMASPRYQGSVPYFESDLDKALYILAQDKPSRSDHKYLQWAASVMGVDSTKSEAHLRELGRQVRTAVGKAKQRREPIPGAPGMTALVRDVPRVIDLTTTALEEPPPPPGLPASRATGGVPQPSPAAPPRSVGHVAFVGDVKTGIVEFFEIKVGDEAHIYSAPADQPLTPAGVRKPKSWVGLADDDTRARVAAMQRLAKRERARRGRLQAGFDPAEVIADVIDHYRAKRAEDRTRLNAAAARTSASKARPRIPGALPDIWEGPPPQSAPAAEGPPPPSTPPAPPPPSTPGAPAPSGPSQGLPKYAGSINLHQRIDHGEDVLDLFQETYRLQQPLVDEARGGTQTIAQIRQAASILGMGEKAVEHALARKPGAAENAKWLWAINEGLKETSKATIEHAKLFLTTPEISRTPEMEASLIAQLARHTAVFASVSGANSEAGRALGILNRIRVAGEDARKLQDVIQNYGRTRGAQRETIAEIATLLSKIPQEDVRALGKFVRQVTKPTRGDKIYEYWINALLSGPPTHVSNTLSGVLGAALMPVELGLGATGNALLIGAQKLLPAEVSSRLPRVEKVRYFGEMLHAGKQLLGALDLPLQVAEKLGLARTKLSPEDVTHVAWNRGIREATYAALQAWKTEMPTVGDVNKAYETGQLPGAIGGAGGRAIRTPSRLLLMQDQFFQALIHRMSLNARAYRQAMKEGHTSRLAVADRMAELLENPTQVLKNEAVEEAVYRTFNTELGPIGKDISDLRRKYPLLRIPLTFIRTPVNIVHFGLERTPGVGTYMTFGRALKKFADGELDAGKLSDESAKALLGLGLAWGVATLVQDGIITGSGPKDPAERRTRENLGWEASSIKLGNNYYQYSRLEPLGITVNMIADFVETAQVWETDVDKVPGQIMYALTRNLMDKTWLSGITGLFKTVMDWERYGEGYALRTATSLLPNFFAYTARAMDPKRTIPRDPLQAVVAKAPGGGKLIEALGGVDPTEYARALDIWGREEVLEDTWFERFASPFRRSPVRTDLVTPHLIRLGINLNPPSKTLQDWKDPATGKELPQPQGLDAQVLAQARGYARYALASMVVSNQDFLRIDPDDQREYLHRQLARGSTIVTRRAKALLYAKQPLTMKDLVGELMEQGPPPLE